MSHIVAIVVGLPEEIVGEADLKEVAEADIKNNTKLGTKLCLQIENKNTTFPMLPDYH